MADPWAAAVAGQTRRALRRCAMDVHPRESMRNALQGVLRDHVRWDAGRLARRGERRGRRRQWDLRPRRHCAALSFEAKALGLEAVVLAIAAAELGLVAGGTWESIGAEGSELVLNGAAVARRDGPVALSSVGSPELRD